MAVRDIRASLLSSEQIKHFKSQMSVRNEAAFLAPQLLEQVSILTADLRATVAELDALRSGLDDIELQMASALGAEGGCSRCNHSELRAAIEAFHRLIHQR